MVFDPKDLFNRSLDIYIDDNIRDMKGVYSDLQKEFSHVSPQSAADGALIEAAAVVGKNDVNDFVNIYQQVKKEFPPKYDVGEASVIRASILIYAKSGLQASVETGAVLLEEFIDGLEDIS